MPPKAALVVHSGGVDSSLCLALAKGEFGADKVASVSFVYGQRHWGEVERAKAICADWGVDHIILALDCLQQVTHNALLDASLTIVHPQGEAPTTLVVGRNGLMAHLAGIYAHQLGAKCLYMGVMELEEANSGYRDCSRAYLDLKQAALRLDLGDPTFEIRTPLIGMTKAQTLEVAHALGVLPYLLVKTLTCYEGVAQAGCLVCPACRLRNGAIRTFLQRHPTFVMPYFIGEQTF